MRLEQLIVTIGSRYEWQQLFTEELTRLCVEQELNYKLFLGTIRDSPMVTINRTIVNYETLIPSAQRLNLSHAAEAGNMR